MLKTTGGKTLFTQLEASFLTCLLLSSTISFGGEAVLGSKVELGEELFFDVNLSFNRTMSCATCHSPDLGFIDPRESAAGMAVSLGDDGHSLGDRNTPTAGYARFSPIFHQDEEGNYIGGQFLDGREPDLTGQAGGPPLNPIEMGMPDKASVVARLLENSDYVLAFRDLFGEGIFEDVDAAYLAMASSIAAFEETDFFAPFDSKYDRYLRGEVELSNTEELGKILFFSQQFTNCNVCHQVGRSLVDPEETFSNYEYHNIGVPENIFARSHNGVDADFVDVGLLNNPAVSDPSHAGQFKVPTLRNIAVTGPYMHNGVFEDLRTVVLFYNKYNSSSEAAQINPETSENWRDPEVAENISIEDLEIGPALKARDVDALVAFMKTLTDQRYEHLLTD